jgi:hypothetical protein
MVGLREELTKALPLYFYFESLEYRALNAARGFAAILSFVWLVVLIELARHARPAAGSWRNGELQPA